MDLSSRSGPLGASPEKTTAYYRGYFSAVMRNPEIYEDEPSFLKSFGLNLLRMSIPFGVLYLIGRFAARSAAADVKGMMSMMTEPQRNFKVEVKDIKFKDIIGVPEAKAEVQQYVEFLKEPAKFSRLGARMPRGCLLTGQPGTGKTLLAKAVAGEANVPFFSCSGADFIEVFLGSGPKMVRKVFDEARAAGTSIIFIDEIDAIGTRSSKDRQSSSSGGSNEENRTINQLLTELDGLASSNSGVVVFAATNFAENIDQALLREGFFDRKVELAMPDIKARRELFEFYLKKVVTGDRAGYQGPPPTPLVPVPEGQTPPPPPPPQAPLPPGDNAKLSAIMADLTPGLSPATIAAVVNEAAIAAATAQEPIVKLPHLKEAIDDVLVGKKHRSRMTPEAAARIALHEVGHATVAWMLPQQNPVLKIRIIPRGNAGGFTQQAGREAGDPMTHNEFFSTICVLLAGRCAESSRLSDLTTGDVDDYQRATEQTMQSFLALGMSAKVGRVAFNQQSVGKGRIFVTHSMALQRAAEEEAKRVIQLAFDATKAILADNKEKVEAMANELVQKQSLDAADVERHLGPRPVKSPFSPVLLEEIHKTYMGATQRLPSLLRKEEQTGANVAVPEVLQQS